MKILKTKRNERKERKGGGRMLRILEVKKGEILKIPGKTTRTMRVWAKFQGKGDIKELQERFSLLFKKLFLCRQVEVNGKKRKFFSYRLSKEEGIYVFYVGELKRQKKDKITKWE